MKLGNVLMLAALAGPMVVSAEEHIVRAEVTNYSPLVVFAQPGDSITWVNMLGHDTVSVEGMVPADATPWQSELSKQFTISVTAPGAYIYKCTPHIATGMLGAIIVGAGEPANLAEIDAALEQVPAHKNMVARVIRKMKKALTEQAQTAQAESVAPK